jgi:ureidoacrylate peracid hydrolase
MHDITVTQEIKDRLLARRGRIHIYDELESAKTAFVCIDMQNAFCKEGAPAEVPASRGIVERTNEFNRALRAAGVEVIWIVSAFGSHAGRSDWENFFATVVSDAVRDRTMAYMSPGAEGTLIWHDLEVAEEDTHIVKNRYSCLTPGSSALERVLRSHGIENVLIGGTKTNVCCESAARDAFQLDFNVIMVEDCNAALSDREHLAGLENIIQQFGDVMTSAEVLQRLKP